MQTTVLVSAPDQVASPALVVGLAEQSPLPPELERIDPRLDGLLQRLVQEGALTGRTETREVIHTLGRLPAARVVVIGIGKGAELDLKRLTDWCVRATRRLRQAGVAEATVCLPPVAGATRTQVARAAVEGFQLGNHDFRKYKTTDNGRGALRGIAFLAADPADAEGLRTGIAIGEAVAAGMTFARDLGNEPANVATPTFLAERAREMAAAHGLACQVLGPREMAELGMGAVLAVAQGSDEPPTFIVVEKPGADGAPTLAFVGKGITFDSGGISIKPSARMHEMKFDMSGGAAVLGSLLALSRLGATARVVGLVPCSENLPSGRAVKPGDIIRSLAGLTIEVTNTDAEGRLLLADALTYARRFAPHAVIDVATLTGAVVAALGAHAIGAMSNDPGLLEAVRTAAQRTGERVWPLPVGAEYLEDMKSTTADLVNSSNAGGKASTAAAFLSRFAEGLSWVHLDIAGMAWIDGVPDAPVQGATGVGVRTLVETALAFRR